MAALLATTSVRAAAKECGLSPNTIYSRLRDKDFADRYYSARLEMLKNHVAQLHGHLGTAIETLSNIMSDANAPAQTRVNAAEAILRNCMRLTEQAEFNARLSAVEMKKAKRPERRCAED